MKAVSDVSREEEFWKLFCPENGGQRTHLGEDVPGVGQRLKETMQINYRMSFIKDSF